MSSQNYGLSSCSLACDSSFAWVSEPHQMDLVDSTVIPALRNIEKAHARTLILTRVLVLLRQTKEPVGPRR